ncbi:MAG: AAA family ATPase [Candidatus Hodarchaeota archaeon]
MKYKPHPAIEFFEALYPDGAVGFANFRFITPQGEVKRNAFIGVGEISQELPPLLKKHQDCNVYFQPSLVSKQGGGKKHILQIWAIPYDMDFQGGFTYEDWYKLPPLPGGLRASIFVNSGRGIHGYFLLKSPLGRNDIPRLEDISKRLATWLKADLQATEASHLFRVVGTRNLKYDPPRKVKITRFNPDVRYDLSDFDCLPKPEAPESESLNPPGWEKPIIEEGVSQGERNATLAKLAGKYVRKGLSKQEILPLLLDVNSRFQPPLDEKEVRTVLDSILKTHERNHPEESEKVSGESKRNRLQLKTLGDIFSYPDPTYLVDPLLIEGTVTILGAYTGTGKSIAALSIIKSVLTSTPLWNKFPVVRSGPVLLVDEETPAPFLKERLGKLGFSRALPIHFLHFQEVRLDKEDVYQELIERIGETAPVLVVIDSLIRIHRQREDDATAMSLVVDRLRKIANSGTTVLVIHHHRKAEGPLSQKLRGSSDIPGGVDVEYALVPKEDCLVLSSVKTRTKPFGPVRLKMDVTEETIEVKYLGTVEEELISEAIDILADEEMGAEDIYKEMKDRGYEWGRDKVRSSLLRAEGRELIVKKGSRGKYLFSVNPAYQFTSPIYPREAGKLAESIDRERIGPTNQSENVQKASKLDLGEGVSLLSSLSSMEGDQQDQAVDRQAFAPDYQPQNTPPGKLVNCDSFRKAGGNIPSGDDIDPRGGRLL